MSVYFNAFIMLAATITAFVLLAKLAQAIRMRRFALPWRVSGLERSPLAPSRLAVEQTCVVDGKRRLLLIRCDERRVLLLTGGPADLIVSVLPDVPAAEVVA
jgi:flagellar protein FliO/FliZ